MQRSLAGEKSRLRASVTISVSISVRRVEMKLRVREISEVK